MQCFLMLHTDPYNGFLLIGILYLQSTQPLRTRRFYLSKNINKTPAISAPDLSLGSQIAFWSVDHWLNEESVALKTFPICKRSADPKEKVMWNLSLAVLGQNTTKS